jgi:hypothetical protein
VSVGVDSVDDSALLEIKSNKDEARGSEGGVIERFARFIVTTDTNNCKSLASNEKTGDDDGVDAQFAPTLIDTKNGWQREGRC